MLIFVAALGLGFLWFRPLYGFLVTFAVCLFLMALLLGGLPGYLSLAHDHPEVLSPPYILAFISGFASSLGMLLAVFVILGSAIVAFRKWRKARKARRDEEVLNAQVARARAEGGDASG